MANRANKTALQKAATEAVPPVIPCPDKFLTRDEILAADDLKSEVVLVPEWGGKVKVRGASAADRESYDHSMLKVNVDDKGKTTTELLVQNSKARLVVRCVVDPATGDRLFKDEDAEAVGRKAAPAVERIFQRVAALSGFSAFARKSIEGN